MTKKFIFRSNLIIGAAAAEMDQHFLNQCFVDTGALKVICTLEDPRRVLVGRTGSGKTALLLKLAEDEESVIRVDPESLALTYIANSNILKFFFEAGVKMDIFYRLLWRHIFCVEILKSRFRIDSEESKKSFIDILWRLIPKNKEHERALGYLREWGESFWLETEYRIQEVTKKLEDELTGTIGIDVKGIGSLGSTAARKLTEEQKEEIVYRAQEMLTKFKSRSFQQ